MYSCMLMGILVENVFFICHVNILVGILGLMHELSVQTDFLLKKLFKKKKFRIRFRTFSCMRLIDKTFLCAYDRIE